MLFYDRRDDNHDDFVNIEFIDNHDNDDNDDNDNDN
jgi:hypothetical protein